MKNQRASNSCSRTPLVARSRSGTLGTKTAVHLPRCHTMRRQQQAPSQPNTPCSATQIPATLGSLYIQNSIALCSVLVGGMHGAGHECAAQRPCKNHPSPHITQLARSAQLIEKSDSPGPHVRSMLTMEECAAAMEGRREGSRCSMERIGACSAPSLPTTAPRRVPSQGSSSSPLRAATTCRQHLAREISWKVVVLLIKKISPPIAVMLTHRPHHDHANDNAVYVL